MWTAVRCMWVMRGQAYVGSEGDMSNCQGYVGNMDSQGYVSNEGDCVELLGV